MSSLSVPQVRTNAIKKSGSHSSLRSSVETDNDLAAVTQRSSSRRNSETSVNNAAAPTLTRPPTQAHATTNTTLYAGRSQKPYIFETKALKAKLPFFKKLLAETPEPSAEQTSLDDADEASMALLQQWVKGSKALRGPCDFHTIGHYLGLYVLGRRFEAEALQNLVMDLLRAHYGAENLTAPPYRLEYIYTLANASPMQGFLLATAAQRCKYSKDQPAVSDTLFGVLQPRADLMRDFLEYVIHADDIDVRYGSNCV
ncbi:hypothetical protein LTR85_010149 [Meristemomyces frigidus]|nr:hypothetical protein LTR85_010149 [Meristemomyces frigidus]